MRTHPIDYYRSRLRVSKHALDDELEDHADLLDQIGFAEARAATDVARTKDELARVEARLGDDYRDSGERLSVDDVKRRVVRNRERIAAFNAHIAAVEVHGAWKSLYEAWKSRGFNMKTTGQLFADQYFAPRSVDAKAAPRREQEYNEGRQALKQRRSINR